MNILSSNNPALGLPVKVLMEVKKHCSIVAIPLKESPTKTEQEIMHSFVKCCYDIQCKENQIICVVDDAKIPAALWIKIFAYFGEQTIVEKLL